MGKFKIKGKTSIDYILLGGMEVETEPKSDKSQIEKKNEGKD